MRESCEWNKLSVDDSVTDLNRLLKVREGSKQFPGHGQKRNTGWAI